VCVFSRLFRRLPVEKLLAAFDAVQLQFFGAQADLAARDAFAAFLAPRRKVEWVVYAKRPFGGPEVLLAYLARYTHRVALAKSRLFALRDGAVTFKWKDYRLEGRDRQKTMTLPVCELIRRFLIRVLPSAFIAFATTVCSPAALARKTSHARISCSPRRCKPVQTTHPTAPEPQNHPILRVRAHAAADA
jgi:hypothetical protein